jgi:hypothetical protein
MTFHLSKRGQGGGTTPSEKDRTGVAAVAATAWDPRSKAYGHPDHQAKTGNDSGSPLVSSSLSETQTPAYR